MGRDHLGMLNIDGMIERGDKGEVWISVAEIGV
jgi:hypothetical protein